MSKIIVNIICVIALATGALGCTEGDSLTINIAESFRIPLTKSLAPNSRCQKFFETEDGQQLLYYMSSHNNSITIFDLDEEKIVNEIILPEEGPNGVGYLGGFSVLSPDSILLSAEGLRHNFIINSKGEIIYKLIHKNTGQQPEFTGLWTIYYVDAKKIGAKIYLPQSIPYVQGVRPDGEHRPILEHDLSSKQSKTIDFLFPEEVYEKNMPLTTLFAGGDDCLLYGLSGSSEFYVHDIKSGFTKKVKSKSSYIQNPIENLSKVGGIDDYMMYNAKNPRYMGNYYDKYRNCYYRVVSHPHRDPKVAMDKYVQLSQYPVRISIILMDEKFNAVQEFILPEGKYVASGMFINKDGIHMPKSNPSYVQFEDSVSYDLITFDKI